jgi:hypothetical protein
MLEFNAFGSLSVALVSFLLSLTALVIHYAKRHDNPVTAPLQQQIDALRLGQTDLIDRVDQWTKRDRTRRLRERDAEPDPAVIPNDKAQLRMIAKQRGLIR